MCRLVVPFALKHGGSATGASSTLAAHWGAVVHAVCCTSCSCCLLAAIIACCASQQLVLARCRPWGGRAKVASLLAATAAGWFQGLYVQGAIRP